MNDDLDRQPTRNPWPWPVDTPLDRARKIAGMYRRHLLTVAPGICSSVDDTAREFGETWMLEKLDVLEPSAELTTAEAAELAQTDPATIRHWACCKHPDHPDQLLLPRFGWRGRERTYIAAKVLEAAALAATKRLAR